MRASSTKGPQQFLTRYPATLCGATVCLLLIAGFWSTGTLAPDRIPNYASSRREIIGMALMLIALPSYFAAAAVVIRRHSLALIESLRSQVARSADIDAARDSLRGGGSWQNTWLPGAALGLVMGSLNTSIFEALEDTGALAVHLAISLGQILLWLTIGLFFAVRMNAARTFRRLGDLVELDLFAVDRLQPLARSGLADVMVIAGAVAFTPLQSLDAGFRWYNYQFGLGVAIIASTILLLWPLFSIHRRIRSEKAKQLEVINGLIASVQREDRVESVARLETLLSHRDRIRDLRTWPLSTNLLSRFFLYLIIPPLAWVGAALVERFVDRFLSG
jgi:hypothetical protein